MGEVSAFTMAGGELTRQRPFGVGHLQECSCVQLLLSCKIAGQTAQKSGTDQFVAAILLVGAVENMLVWCVLAPTLSCACTLPYHLFP